MDISSLSVGIFTWLLQYFPQNRVISVQKLGAEKKIVKIRFRLGKPQKKVPPLMAGPLRKKELSLNFFFILLPKLLGKN